MPFHPARPLLLATLVLMLAACGKPSPDQAAASGNKAEIKAGEMPEVAKKYSCNSCHAINMKVVGPAWMDVSKKYQGDAGAAAMLGDKIIKGGGGVWGVMPMPANPKISDAEKKELVDFILGLAK